VWWVRWQLNICDIRRLGRWNIHPDGIWSGWGGSQLKFKANGSITVNANVIKPVGAVAYCECVIDNSPENSILRSFVNGSATFDMTGEHEVIIKTNGYRADIFNQVSRSIITSIDGDIENTEPNPLLVQCVGDSWMAADNDWPRLMRDDMFDTYQIATGGMTCAQMNSDYNYNAAGILADDPIADVVILSFGVNDYNSSISIASFQSSLTSLVAKIRDKQSCPIFLIQVPAHIGDAFNQYGQAMNAVAGGDIHYIPTNHLSVTWQVDNKHLSPQSKVVLADYIGEQIISMLHIRKDFMRIAGQSISGESVITKKHALRYHGSIEFGVELKLATNDSLIRIMANGNKYTF
jgi:hypothetical protein